jgi:transposase
VRGLADPSLLRQDPPVSAQSGGGDRQANAALYRIVLSRLRHDQQTKDYAARRRQQGKSNEEIIRCLKRYVTREVYAVLRPMSC